MHPTRKDIFRVDARKLPPELTGKADFVFIDPPYSTHLDYGPDPRDIGKLDAAERRILRRHGAGHRRDPPRPQARPRTWPCTSATRT